MVSDTLVVELATNPWTGAANRRDRAAVSKRRGPYNRKTAGYVAFVERVRLATVQAIRAQGVCFPTGAVSVELFFTSPRRCRQHGVPDWLCVGDTDGPTKAAIDGLAAGGAVSNDVQVARIVLEKRVGPYGLRARITAVEVGPVSP